MARKIQNSTAAVESEQIVQMFSEFLSEVNNAFLSNRLSLRYQQATGELAKKLRQKLAKFYEGAEDLPGREALTVQATAINFSKIFYDLLRLSGMVETKIREKVMFSDEAVKEVTEIMRRTRELLPHVADAVMTGNELIVKHVKKEAEELTASAQASAKTHEERLCRNICHPKASVIFMQMLQALQDILWHFQAIVSEQNGLPHV